MPNHMKYTEMQKKRIKTWKSLSEAQQEALLVLLNNWEQMTQSYRELCHPMYDDIVNMDNSVWKIRSLMVANDEQ